MSEAEGNMLDISNSQVKHEFYVLLTVHACIIFFSNEAN